MGFYAGQALTTAGGSVHIGSQAGYYTTTGTYNTVIGNEALYRNVVGSYNTVIGHKAGQYATGSNNTYIGFYSGQGASNSAPFSSANQNTGVGMYTMQLVTTGGNNTALGYGAINKNSTGIIIKGVQVTPRRLTPR